MNSASYQKCREIGKPNQFQLKLGGRTKAIRHQIAQSSATIPAGILSMERIKFLLDMKKKRKNSECFLLFKIKIINSTNYKEFKYQYHVYLNISTTSSPQKTLKNTVQGHAK